VEWKLAWELLLANAARENMRNKVTVTIRRM
jgi:hypothetical protein